MLVPALVSYTVVLENLRFPQTVGKIGHYSRKGRAVYVRTFGEDGDVVHKLEDAARVGIADEPMEGLAFSFVRVIPRIGPVNASNNLLRLGNVPCPVEENPEFGR